jgi:hypothetical protein
MNLRVAHSLVVSALVAGAVVLASPRPARADVAPQDACTAPGQPCMNAAPDYHTDGTCTASTCLRTVPDGDGGVTTMEYACNLCKAASNVDAGSEDAGGEDASSEDAASEDAAGDGPPIDEIDSGAADGASEGSGGDDSGCSCALGGGPARGAGGERARRADAFGLAILGLGTAVASLRRGRRRRVRR